MTPELAKKMYIKDGTKLYVDPALSKVVDELPEGAEESPEKGADIALVSVSSKADAEALKDLSESTTYWLCYPKGNKADINRDSVVPYMTDLGFAPNRQVALSEELSALRFGYNPEKAKAWAAR